MASVGFVASKYGRLEIMMWLSQNDSLNEGMLIDCCQIAASHGHLHILQWMYKLRSYKWSEFRFPHQMDLNDSKLKLSYQAILDWSVTVDCDFNPGYCAHAAAISDLHRLKHLWQLGYPMDETTCAYAALNGDLAMLKWARSKGCEWNAITCYNAGACGHLELLSYARSQGCPWDSDFWKGAAMHGQVEILKYARSMDYPWHHLTGEYVCYFGKLNVLIWAHSEHLFLNPNIVQVAVARGHLHILQWADANGYTAHHWLTKNHCMGQNTHPYPFPERLFETAVRFGHLPIIEWMNTNVGYKCDIDLQNYDPQNDIWQRLAVYRWAEEQDIQYDVYSCARMIQKSIRRLQKCTPGKKNRNLAKVWNLLAAKHIRHQAEKGMRLVTSLSQSHFPVPS